MAPKRKKLNPTTVGENHLKNLKEHIFPKLALQGESPNIDDYQYIGIDQLKLHPKSAPNFVLVSRKTFHFATGLRDVTDTADNSPVHHNYFLSSSNGVAKYESSSTQPAISVDKFYSRVCEKQVENSVFDGVVLPPIDALIPTLRTYQESAVKWMIYREKHNSAPKNYAQNVFVDQPILLGSKEKLYYNRNFGYFITGPVYTEYLQALKPSLGGILADEMGLGKTVETLALILHNKKETIPPKFNFFNRKNLFSLTEHPRWGYLQCSCGMESTALVEPLSTSKMIESSLRKKYHLNEEFIKCLSCGNYQHIQCSGYQLNEDDFPYICGRCWPKVDPIDSGCTLIVCPRSILHQWEDEIAKHLKDVKVCVYKGIKNNDSIVFPANLAANDIVLTTYDVLRSELNFSKSFELDQLRISRRYFRAVSPLLSIHWWRLCFDEAQMVENTYSMVARMAESLSATYRWAITGTPIQRSVDDLFGLLYFINEKPYCSRPVWDTELYEAFLLGHPEPLINAIVSCFWRTPKSAVIDELDILAPIYTERRLELSQIERDFYLTRARDFYQKLEARFVRESPNTMLGDVRQQSSRMAVLSMATTLRQTCCHPTWALNNLLRWKNRQLMLHNQRTPTESNRVYPGNRVNRRRYVSLNDVLDNLIEGVKVEAEGAHREIISCLNGLAAAQAWRGDTGCVVTYKDALESIEKYAEHVRTDKTQKYHIYYNLAQILETVFGVRQVVAPVAGDIAFELSPNLSPEHLKGLKIDPEGDRLMRSHAKALYDQYISNEQVAFMGANKYRKDLNDKCAAIEAKFQLSEGKWYIGALAALEPYVELGELVEILNHNVHKETEGFIRKEPSLMEIQYKLDNSMDNILVARSAMICLFTPLHGLVLTTEGETFVRCHIRKVPRAEKCILCKVEDAVKKYEKLLFSLQIKKKVHRKKRGRGQENNNEINDEINDDDNNNNNNNNSDEEDDEDDLFMDAAAQIELNNRVRRRDELNWNECNTLVALRRVAAIYKARSKRFAKSEVEVMVKDIDNFTEFIEEIKKEFKAHRRYWTSLFDYTLRLDELNQAQLRMTFADRSVDGIEAECESFVLTRESRKESLEAHLERFRYLKNLKESLKDKDAVRSRMCSICWSEPTRYFVLACGHFFCESCLAGLLRHGTPYDIPEGQIRCSVCRQLSQRDALSFIDSVAAAYQLVEVNGSWSTKIVEVVRTVKNILQTAGDKVLLFSTWPALLYLVNQSLEENNIKSLLVHASRGGNFARNIQTFKRSADVNVLLLPTNFACNGLNLTEANHVIFINSSLNRADELQAVGRVYRIGQRKQTHVYKFIINASIEETIEDTISKVFTSQNGGAAQSVANSEFDGMTVNELLRLFSY
ncbi:hypothetical protein TYRP_017856 [Tyrophagus putrescentiae]|nr:hypothetical protein TYRP_017856 [Tyrophagus putrescentiae]